MIILTCLVFYHFLQYHSYWISAESSILTYTPICIATYPTLERDPQITYYSIIVKITKGREREGGSEGEGREI